MGLKTSQKTILKILNIWEYNDIRIKFIIKEDNVLLKYINLMKIIYNFLHNIIINIQKKRYQIIKYLCFSLNK